MDERRKRIRFRAWRRGFREIDLILGGFADKAVASLSEGELAAFEALLDEADQDVYAWITGAQAAPEHARSAFLERLQAFVAAGGAEQSDAR